MRKLPGIVAALILLLSLTAQAENSVANATELVPAQTVVVDGVCEYTLEHAMIVKEVVPPQNDGYYTYYKSEEGQVYVDICFAVKNLSSEAVTADTVMEGVLLYAEQYRYNGFAVIEKENRSDFSYANITDIASQATEYVHYLFQMPEEAAICDASAVAVMSFGEQTYTLTLNEGDNTGVGMPREDAVEKTEGDLAQGEWVLIPGQGEFRVDSVTIAQKIAAPRADVYNLMKEAGEGNVFVDICVEYRSLKTEPVRANRFMSGVLTYNADQQFDGTAMIEGNGRADLKSASINVVNPLCSYYMHYMFEVPAEAADSDLPMDVQLTVDGCTYSFKAR